MPNILVVEDDPFFRAYVRMCLEHLGHQVIEAVDGATGLIEFARQQPDLVITDIFMPNKDGFEFIHEVCGNHSTAKVIAMTIGYSSDQGECLDRALDVGAKAAVCKPFSIDQLNRAIGAVLELPTSLARKCTDRTPFDGVTAVIHH